MKKTAINELRNVWGRVGLGGAPAPEETKNTLELPARRAKSDRTAQLNSAHPAWRKAADRAHGAARKRFDQRDLLAHARALPTRAWPRRARHAQRRARIVTAGAHSRDGSQLPLCPRATARDVPHLAARQLLVRLRHRPDAMRSACSLRGRMSRPMCGKRSVSSRSLCCGARGIGASRSSASIAWFVCLLSGINSAIGVYVEDRAALTGVATCPSMRLQ